MKISSRDSFPHFPPYDLLYAERIPLLHTFRSTIEGIGWRRVEGDKWGYSREKILDILPYSKRFLAAECGVYLGNSLIACSKIIRDYFAPVHIYGLDTFSGLPELSEMDLVYSPKNAPYRHKRLFSDAPLEMVREAIERENLDEYVTLVPGLFKDTLSVLPQDRKFLFINIDCDLYLPHLECLEFFYPRMEKGGVVFFDDYHSVEFPMAKEAIDKFMEGRSEKLFHLSFGPDKPNFKKAFFVKD